MAWVSHKVKGSTDPAIPLLLKVLRTRSHKTSYVNVHGSLVNSQNAETTCQLMNRWKVGNLNAHNQWTDKQNTCTYNGLLLLCCLVSKSCLNLYGLMDLACRAPLSMGFSRQEYWSGLPCPPPGDLPNPGIEPCLLHCWQILYHWATRKSPIMVYYSAIKGILIHASKWISLESMRSAKSPTQKRHILYDSIHKKSPEEKSS